MTVANFASCREGCYHAPAIAPRSPEATPSSQHDPPPAAAR